jgi:hypothetical protein
MSGEYEDPLFPWDEYEDDEWNDDDDPMLCLVPDDCPNGPEPHEWIAAGSLGHTFPHLASLPCCRQPWEEDPPRPIEDVPPNDLL